MTEADRKIIEAEEQKGMDELVLSRTGYTKTALTLAFELVQPEDWKDRIDSFCTSDEVKIIAVAVEYFTATQATFEYVGTFPSSLFLGWKNKGINGSRLKAGDHMLKVQAIGYRMGPAGDH